MTDFMRRNFLLLFGAIWLAAGLPFLLIGLGQLRQQLRFDNEAVQTDALVLSKEVRSADSGTQHFVFYRLQAENGEVVEGLHQTDFPRWDALTEGGTVRVEYLPSDPTTNRIVGEVDREGTLVFVVLGGVFSVAGGGIFLFALKKLRRRRHLLAKGMTSSGEVIEVGPTSFRINNRQQWSVKFRYIDHYGQSHEGESEYLDPSEGERWQVGEQGAIKFDPEDPASSLWLGRQDP